MNISTPSIRERAQPDLPIPATAHFIWLGATFPWTHVLAVASAAKNGGFSRIVLHLDTPDAVTPHKVALAACETPVEVRAVVPARIFAALGPEGARLAGLYQRLDKPAAKANVLRVALLYVEGGVYFDMDTITLRSLTPLRRLDRLDADRVRRERHHLPFAALACRAMGW